MTTAEQNFIKLMHKHKYTLNCIVSAVAMREIADDIDIQGIYISHTMKPTVMKELTETLNLPLGVVLESGITIGSRFVAFNNVSTPDMQDYGITVWAATPKGIVPLI